MDEEDFDYDFQAGEMVRNIPGSAMQLAKDLGHAVLNPWDTLDAVTGTLAGGLQAGLEGIGIETDGQHLEEWDRAKQFYADRYGGIDESQRSLEKDPMGVFSDVVGGLGLMGSTRVARLARTLDPINATANAVEGAVRGARIPQRLYEPALKPSTTTGGADNVAKVDTGIREGFPTTHSGVEMLDSRVAELGQQVDGMLAQNNTPIPIETMNRHVDALRERLGRNNIYGDRDVAHIDRVMDNWNEMLERQGITEFSPSDVQELKKNLYQQINYDKRNPQRSPTFARSETEQAIARAAREVLEEVEPGIVPLNQRMGQMLDLRDDLTRAAGRAGNRQGMGFHTPSTGMATGMAALGVSGDPLLSTGVGLLGAGANAVLKPGVNSRMGILMDRVVNNSPYSGTAIGQAARAGMMEGSQMLQENEQWN